MTLVGYDPARVTVLADRTRATIESLATIRSPEPSAAGALEVVRLILFTLEEHWMPLLRGIQASSAMTHWTIVGRSIELETPVGSVWVFYAGESRFEAMTDAELLEYVGELDDEAGSATDDQLRSELAARMQSDPSFCNAVLDELNRSPTLATILAAAPLSGQLRVQLAERMLADLSVMLQWEDMPKYAAAVGALMTSIADEPEWCLRALQSPEIRIAFAEWDLLDQELVASIASTALRYPIETRPEMLGAGQALLRDLIVMSHDEWYDERGFGPGLSAGISSSLGLYLPTFIGSIEDPSGWVFANDRYEDALHTTKLGSYGEVAEFLGTLAKVPEGQFHLGIMIADAARAAVAGDARLTVDATAELGTMLGRGVDNENNELALDAAAQRAAIQQVTGYVTIGVSLATGPLPIGPLTRAAIGPTMGWLGSIAAGRIDTPTSGAPSYLGVVRSALRVSAIRRVMSEPELRSELGLEDIPDIVWDEELAVLDRLAQLDPSDAGDAEITAQTLHRAEQVVRDAGGSAYLDGILERPSTHELAHPSD